MDQDKDTGAVNMANFKNATVLELFGPPEQRNNQCNCKVEEGKKCLNAQSCQNRLKCEECPVTCGPECQNQPFRRNLFKTSLMRKQFPGGRLGVVSVEAIEDNEFVMQFDGDAVIKRDNPALNLGLSPCDLKFSSTTSYGRQLIVVVSSQGGLACYVNYSHAPNLNLITCCACDGTPKNVLIARQRIEAGSELLLDYGEDYWKGIGLNCDCGATQCPNNRQKGTLTMKNTTSSTANPPPPSNEGSSAAAPQSMSDIDDPHYHDKLFARLMGYRYIKKCDISPGLEEGMAAWAKVAANAAKVIVCSCQTDMNGMKCRGTDCSMRAAKMECDKSCGANCSNRLISKKLHPGYLQFKPVDGLGIVVATIKKIISGSPIIEYTGTVWSGEPKKNQKHALPITRVPVGEKMYINSEEEGNLSRMIPNSSTPNCDVQDWIVGKRICLLIVASKDIQVGEVLTLSYPQFQ